MKKFVLIIFSIIILISNFNFISLAEGMSTYENLCSLEDEFIIKFRAAQIPDEMLKAFIDDMDAVVNGFQENIYAQDADAYFITIFLQTIQKEEYIPMLIAFDSYYQEEIVYMLQYKKVPDSMSNFKRILFNNKLIFELPSYTDDEFEENIVEDDIINEEPDDNKVNVTPLPFNDISDYPWAVESIIYLYNHKVVNGTSEKIFSPDQPITREEFIKMVVAALLKTDPLYEQEFGARGQGKWYHSYLAAAEFYALTPGIYDEDEFTDDLYITRQDMCAIAYRAALRAYIKLPDIKYSTDFLDMHLFEYYSIHGIKELQEADIIHGTGNNMFEPNSTTTRAEAAKIIHKLMLLK